MGRARQLGPGISDLDLLRDLKRIVDLHAEVPNGAFDLRVAKPQLNGSQIAGSPIDQGCLCPPHGMRGVLERVEANVTDPLRYEPGVLPHSQCASGPRRPGNKRWPAFRSL